VNSSAPLASVVIVTKDRKDDALRAVRSAVAQEGDVEVILVDDGSSDGTAAAVSEEFPGVRIARFEASAGYIVRRNGAAELARGRYVFSIDDDAELGAETTVVETVGSFENERVGAVAIPYVDVPDMEIRQLAPDEAGVHATSFFRGTAYAVRRDLFIALGGFRGDFVHQAEEREFCLRMLGAGRIVALGRGAPIRHFVSSSRDVDQMWFYGCRNDVLTVWRHVPMPYLPGRLAMTVAHLVWLGVGVRRPVLFLRGTCSGLRHALSASRRPMPRRLYRLYRTLERRGAMPLNEIVASLPALSEPGGGR
jgi:GT2 family glycosyltransferase